MPWQETDWSLGETLVWICTRDEIHFGALRFEGSPSAAAYIEVLENRSRREVGPCPLLAGEEGDRQLRDALSAGKLTATGVLGGARRRLPRHSWSARHFLWKSSEVRDPVTSERWEDVLFARRSVLELWPPQSKAKPGPKPGMQADKRELVAEAKRVFGDPLPNRGFKLMAVQLRGDERFGTLSVKYIAEILSAAARDRRN